MKSGIEPADIGDRRQALALAAALLLLLAATFAAYWPGRGGGFVFDDYPNIVSNAALRVSAPDSDGWAAAALSSPARNLPRPLAMLSFALNERFTGLDPVALKLTNVGIHLANALLAFGMLCALLALVREAGEGQDLRDDRWAAFFATGAWALHPINVTAVLFIVQRMESLSHTFVLAGLWLYFAGRQRQLRGQQGWPQIATGLFLGTTLGCLSKESAALLPLYALLAEACVLRFRAADAGTTRALRIGAVAFACLALLAGAWALHGALAPAAFANRDFSLSERLLTEPRVLVDYLRWILLPDLGSLSFHHDDFAASRGLLSPPSTALAIAGLSGLAALAAWLRKRRPVACLGLCWFLAAHALTATVLPLELMFEHRNYFASLGIALAAADLLLRWPRPQRFRGAKFTLALCVLAALASFTTLRAMEWSDPLEFAVAEAAKRPSSPRATYYLGYLMANATGYRADSPLLPQAYRALQHAQALADSNILPDQALLILAARTGGKQDPRWWQHMQSRLASHQIGPQETGGLNGLTGCAIAHLCTFPPDQMLATFAAALSHGDNPAVLNAYANYALNVLGDRDLAWRLWQEAHRLDPGEPQHRISMIKMLILMGRYGEARTEIAALRGMGRFGRFDAEVARLQRRLAEAEARTAD